MSQHAMKQAIRTILQIYFAFNTTGVVAYKLYLHERGQFVYDELGSKYGATAIYLIGKLV